MPKFKDVQIGEVECIVKGGGKGFVPVFQRITIDKNKYMPNQGKQEKARRAKKLEDIRDA